MKILRAPLAALFAFGLVVLSAIAPASADRINHYWGINPSDQMFNLEERYQRLLVGQLIFNALGNSTTGYDANVCVTPSSGMYVQVAGCAPYQIGTVYQFIADDTAAVGGSVSGGVAGGVALAADPTGIMVPGTVSSTPLALGPLAAPGTSGQSIAYLVECQVQTVDRTPITAGFQSSLSVVSSATVNRDRDDIVACQTKASSAATSPTTPTGDTGWLTVAVATVPYGATSSSSFSIAMIAAARFYGFPLATPAGGISVAELPHGDYPTVDGSGHIPVSALPHGTDYLNSVTSVNANIGVNLTGLAAQLTLSSTPTLNTVEVNYLFDYGNVAAAAGSTAKIAFGTIGSSVGILAAYGSTASGTKPAVIGTGIGTVQGVSCDVFGVGISTATPNLCINTAGQAGFLSDVLVGGILSAASGIKANTYSSTAGVSMMSTNGTNLTLLCPVTSGQILLQAPSGGVSFNFNCTTGSFTTGGPIGSNGGYDPTYILPSGAVPGSNAHSTGGQVTVTIAAGASSGSTTVMFGTNTQWGGSGTYECWETVNGSPIIATTAGTTAVKEGLTHTTTAGVLSLYTINGSNASGASSFLVDWGCLGN